MKQSIKTTSFFVRINLFLLCMKMIFKYLFQILLFCITSGVFAQSNVGFSDIENQIFTGNFQQADSLINFSLKQNPSNKDKAELYHFKGNIQELKGDIDEALTFWSKSNDARLKAYPKNDYHLAWNYALLSNYYYEKINTPLAKSYADSCFTLIENLTIEQQKEIQIYRIWNILAQSIKQGKNQELTIKEQINFYKNNVQSLYLKSITFQLKHQTQKHYLAKTYHLIGNSYVDLSALYFSSENDNFTAKMSYQNALTWYNKALNCWEQLYGKTHFEKAKTYFLMALLQGYLNEKIFPQKLNDALMYYDKSLKAFGLENDAVSEKVIQQIANKEDLLMCLKYYTTTLIEQFIRTKNINQLTKAEKINRIAKNIWSEIQNEFVSKNNNKNLAIYNLMPQEEEIKIVLLKKESFLNWSMDTIFTANQQLKYYDFCNWNKHRFSILSIKDIQHQLNKEELYVDFFYKENYYAIFITKDSCWMVKFNDLLGTNINNLNQGILNVDFNAFTTNALEIYKNIFNGFTLNDYKKLIICPESNINNLRFEALLTSTKGLNTKDYRKLDYLIHHIEIEYCLSASFYRSNQKHETSKFKIDAFAPFNSTLKLSKLPFSDQLVKHLSAKNYCKNEATLRTFLNSTSPILHLSSHGLIDKTYSSNSVLVMSDSLLTIQHIYNSNLQHQLVVLNNCNSSLGKYLLGDGVDGFVRAFHAKGISNTLSNAWEVDDKQSNQLLANFYASLKGGYSTIASLRTAKQTAISTATNSNLAAPYYWAGQQLIGGGLVFEVENDIYLWLWLLGFVAVIVVVYWFFKN